MSSLAAMGLEEYTTLSTDRYVAHSELGYYQGKLWCVLTFRAYQIAGL